MYERHGHAKNGLTRIYGIWQGMRYRCYGESCTSKQHYSGKGVVMCDAWRESFTPFLEWSMANGYTDKLTIDRIDSNGNYEPSNCRWVTMQGNCDLCFQKNAAKVLRLISDKPERATWWIRMEQLAKELGATDSGAVFALDRPTYAQMAAFARDQRDMFDASEEDIACFCGD